MEGNTKELANMHHPLSYQFKLYPMKNTTQKCCNDDIFNNGAETESSNRREEKVTEFDKTRAKTRFQDLDDDEKTSQTVNVTLGLEYCLVAKYLFQ